MLILLTNLDVEVRKQILLALVVEQNFYDLISCLERKDETQLETNDFQELEKHIIWQERRNIQQIVRRKGVEIF